MKQFKQFLKEDMIDDFEIRFGKESDWKKADKLVQAYLRTHAPKHAKALFKKDYVHGPDPLMVAFGDTKKKLNPPVNLNKLYNAIRKLPSSRDKYWDSIPKNKEKDAIGEGTMDPSQFKQNKFVVTYQNKKEKESIKMGFPNLKKAQAYADKGNKVDKAGGEYTIYVNKSGTITKFYDQKGQPAKSRFGAAQRREETEYVPYWSWNNKKIGEGTMSSGIFDSDNNKAKDAARKFAMFLKQNRTVKIELDPENPKKDHKDLQAYTKELMNYVFDDIMLDDLNPNNKKTRGKKANDIVTKRLKELGVKIR